MSAALPYESLEEGANSTPSRTVSLKIVFAGRTASSVLSEGALLQLALCFFLSPARADPYVVGPLIALYALREDDRRALVLYGTVSAASIPLDLLFLFAASAAFLVKLVCLGAIALKGGLLFVALKAHDDLPAARPGRTEPARLQAKFREVVETVLHEVLDTSPPMPAARLPPLAQPRQLPPDAQAAAPSVAAPSAPVRPTRLPASTPTPPPPPPPDGSASSPAASSGNSAEAAASEGGGAWEEV